MVDDSGKRGRLSWEESERNHVCDFLHRLEPLPSVRPRVHQKILLLKMLISVLWTKVMILFHLPCLLGRILTQPHIQLLVPKYEFNIEIIKFILVWNIMTISVVSTLSHTQKYSNNAMYLIRFHKFRSAGTEHKALIDRANTPNKKSRLTQKSQAMTRTQGVNHRPYSTPGILGKNKEEWKLICALVHVNG